MVEPGVTSYLNTVIFCLLAKFVTLLIAVALLFVPNCPFKYFLLSIEIGLLAIIINSFISISVNNAASAKQLSLFLTTPFHIITCPDYFVQSYDGVNVTCLNEYTTPDSKKTYVFGSSPINLVDVIPDDSTMIVDVCNKLIPHTDVAWTDLSGKCQTI